MIRKLVVRSGQLEFWHMASYAFVRGYRACLGARLPATMTRLAFCVVIDRFTAHFMVRVMARQAANSSVICIVAPAACQPVGLEANIRNAQRSLQGDLFPSTVTLSAEVRHLFRGQSMKLGQIF